MQFYATGGNYLFRYREKDTSYWKGIFQTRSTLSMAIQLSSVVYSTQQGITSRHQIGKRQLNHTALSLENSTSWPPLCLLHMPQSRLKVWATVSIIFVQHTYDGTDIALQAIHYITHLTDWNLAGLNFPHKWVYLLEQQWGSWGHVQKTRGAMAISNEDE